MSKQQKPTLAVILSLVSGVFILLGGGMMTVLGWGGLCEITGCRNYGGMMGPGFGMMGNGYAWGYSGALGIGGIFLGLVVILSAVMLYKDPVRHSTWGLLILLIALLSILGSSMSGFGAGLICGLVGGILGLTWKPKTETV